MIIKVGGRILLVMVVLATVACDRVTKHVATTMLADGPGHSYLADTVRLGYVENPGGFLSFGASFPPGIRTAIFTVGTGVMLLAFGAVAIRRRCDGLTAVGLALFISGGGSNWVDRVVRGSVSDFLNIGVGSVRTGVFNVADVAIMLGAGVFVLAEFRKGRTIRSPSEPGDRPA